MSEIFTMGQRVRVSFDTSECHQEGRLHGWATQGRTGTIMWEDPKQPGNHRYVVGYFLPTVVIDGHRYSDQFHNWFSPSEIEAVV